MRCTTLLALALLAGGLATRAAAAGGTATDQAVSLTYDATHWSAGPFADLLGADPAGDALYVAGWWYRAEGDSREFPLPQPDTETYTNGRIHAVWNNLAGKGFRLEENTWVFDHEDPSGGFFTEMLTQNIGPSPKTLTLFHYVDLTIGGTDPGDSAALIAPNVIKFTDGASSAVYSTRYAKYRVAPHPGVVSLLQDTSITTLDDSGLPYGTGDATAAFEMPTFPIPVGAQVQILVSFFVNLPKNHVKGDLLGGLPFSPLIAQRSDLSPYPYVSMMRRTEQLTQFLFNAAPGNSVVGVDDFSGEGLRDQPVFRNSTGQVLIGDTPISGAPTPGLSWRFSATGDFNADGKADIVWRNTSSQKIVIWTMNGSQKIGAIVPSPDQAANYNWNLSAAADFDGDGHRDFLWYNQTTGKIVLWYMDANVVRTAGVFTTPDSVGNNNWRVAAVGDYGKGPAQAGTPTLGTQDIVWQNDTSQKIVIWHMDHAATRTGGVFTVPDTLLPGFRLVGPR